MSEDLIPARRFETRALLRHTAECRIGAKMWQGTVHDFNRGGAFFQPELCLTDGERIDPEDAWMVAGGHERVELRLTVESVEAIRCGTVRWSGCSDIHRCGGFGVKFDR